MLVHACRRPIRPRRSPTRSRSSSAMGPATAPVPDVHRPDRPGPPADPVGVRVHQDRAGRGRQHDAAPARWSAPFPLPADRSAGHGDPDPGVEGQPVRDARPAGHVLDRRRADGCARWAGQASWTRAAMCRTAGSGRTRWCLRAPAAGTAVTYSSQDHAELRVVAACTAPATSSSSLTDQIPRRARCRSRPASWPASGARPGSGSIRGGTARRGSAARHGAHP